MDESLDSLLRELENFGKTNDAAHGDRSRRMLNITRDTGEFLAVLVNSMNAGKVLEIGTSNGYSTIWLALAASRVRGSVRTIEHSEYKVSLARANFLRSGLKDHIDLIHGDAGQYLEEAADNEFDLVFLDSDRSQYAGWWPSLKRVVRTGGLLVVDNAISHEQEMGMFMAIVSRDKGFATSLVPVGNGEFLASKVA